MTITHDGLSVLIDGSAASSTGDGNYGVSLTLQELSDSLPDTHLEQRSSKGYTLKSGVQITLVDAELRLSDLTLWIESGLSKGDAVFTLSEDAAILCGETLSDYAGAPTTDSGIRVRWEDKTKGVLLFHAVHETASAFLYDSQFLKSGNQYGSIKGFSPDRLAIRDCVIRNLELWQCDECDLSNVTIRNGQWAFSECDGAEIDGMLIRSVENAMWVASSNSAIYVKRATILNPKVLVWGSGFGGLVLLDDCTLEGAPTVKGLGGGEVHQTTPMTISTSPAVPFTARLSSPIHNLEESHSSSDGSPLVDTPWRVRRWHGDRSDGVAHEESTKAVQIEITAEGYYPATVVLTDATQVRFLPVPLIAVDTGSSASSGGSSSDDSSSSSSGSASSTASDEITAALAALQSQLTSFETASQQWQQSTSESIGSVSTVVTSSAASMETMSSSIEGVADSVAQVQSQVQSSTGDTSQSTQNVEVDLEPVLEALASLQSSMESLSSQSTSTTDNTNTDVDIDVDLSPITSQLTAFAQTLATLTASINALESVSAASDGGEGESKQGDSGEIVSSSLSSDDLETLKAMMREVFGDVVSSAESNSTGSASSDSADTVTPSTGTSDTSTDVDATAATTPVAATSDVTTGPQRLMVEKLGTRFAYRAPNLLRSAPDSPALPLRVRLATSPLSDCTCTLLLSLTEDGVVAEHSITETVVERGLEWFAVRFTDEIVSALSAQPHALQIKVYCKGSDQSYSWHGVLSVFREESVLAVA